MAKRKMDKSLMDAFDCILFEESVDEVFNLLLRFDYTNVKANLPKEGYNLNGMDEEERFLYLLSGACYEIEGGGEIGEFSQCLRAQGTQRYDRQAPRSGAHSWAHLSSYMAKGAGLPSPSYRQRIRHQSRSWKQGPAHR